VKLLVRNAPDTHHTIIHLSSFIFSLHRAVACDAWYLMIFVACNVQGAPIKNNPLGKIHHHSYCKRFFHEIYSFHRGGFAPNMQQISSQYLLWLKLTNIWT